MSGAFEVLVVGGGAIGLLTAYELAGRMPGSSIAVCDKADFGLEASWAGAGIVPPGSEDPNTLMPGNPAIGTVHPIDLLRGYSISRFSTLAAEFQELTGIDIEFRRTGGMELALDDETERELSESVPIWRELGIAFERVAPQRLNDIEPGLVCEPRDAYWFPDMTQVRNPRLMQALEAACRSRNILLLAQTEVVGFAADANSTRAAGVRLASGKVLCANTVVVTAGAWTQPLLFEAGIDLPLHPVHGQIVALQMDRPLVQRIILAGKLYLVPRSDGIVLVGSTEEDFGFEKKNTPEATAELLGFARSLFPLLEDAKILRCWSGLRPGTDLDHPLLGRVGPWENVWVAAGHFRRGIQLSPATARLLADWILGVPTFFEEESFSLTASCPVKPSFSS